MRVEPRYEACKHIRLCDRVDTGLLRFLDTTDLITYEIAQDGLLRGAAQLEASLMDPFPAHADDFVAAVQEYHRVLFQYAMPASAGRFRGPFDNVTFGGDGVHKRDGYGCDEIVGGVRDAFSYATRKGSNHIERSAAFLAHFFRVHPFTDGNGRIGRFIVRKVCVAEGKTIPSWDNTSKSRRRYVAALEYAHSRCHWRDQGLKFLKKWIARQVQDLGPVDLDYPSEF